VTQGVDCAADQEIIHPDRVPEVIAPRAGDKTGAEAVPDYVSVASPHTQPSILGHKAGRAGANGSCSGASNRPAGEAAWGAG
jgi:hypothetical protein